MRHRSEPWEATRCSQEGERLSGSRHCSGRALALTAGSSRRRQSSASRAGGEIPQHPWLVQAPRGQQRPFGTGIDIHKAMAWCCVLRPDFGAGQQERQLCKFATTQVLAHHDLASTFKPYALHTVAEYAVRSCFRAWVKSARRPRQPGGRFVGFRWFACAVPRPGGGGWLQSNPMKAKPRGFASQPISTPSRPR
jgi:hypothetical protein